MEKNDTNNNDAKVGSGGAKANNNAEHGERPKSNAVEHVELVEEEGGSGSEAAQSPPHQPSRNPFTNLSQVDADLALARTLQEQERAYMMLRMNNEGSDYGSWEAGSYLHDDGDDFEDLHDHNDVDDDDDDDNDDDDEDEDEEYDGTDVDDNEDAFDVHAHSDAGEDDNPSIEFDPNVFSSDEAYARALQDAEEREMAARLLALAGINDITFLIAGDSDETQDHGANSQDAWEDLDPDELSYEELLALGEVVGTENRGLSADTIAALPSVNYKTEGNQNGSNDSCVICRLDYEDGETLTVLSCKHSYHSECINNWLKINKVCPICSVEVSTSGNS
ncbi:E3 ubiquitin ligase BIG BROTHER-related [Quillaja saponaria]|uniref:E3 ubiquitin ligase BIG BROTHER-related n=1 Tax=Quillaja saponaria TaxID=32244 RepID=A0AAD7PGC4_QUISA|nr:E3 ubiquitin ligase BIG BROTHER-related [Quillaja saponaria]